MVDLFFVISGYVLSYKMVRATRTQESGELLHAFVSSVFRRYRRLFGCSAIATILVMLAVHYGSYMPELRKDSVLAQLLDWAFEFARFSNVFTPFLKG